MTASTLTPEEITNSVAQNIADRLKLDPNKVITKLVASLTQSLLKTTPSKQIVQQPVKEVKIPQTSVVQKPLDEIKNQTKSPFNENVSPVVAPLKTIQPAKDFVEDKQKTNKTQTDYSQAQESVFEKQNAFLFDGFTDRGLNKLKEELPDIIKKGVTGLITSAVDKKKEEPAKPGGNLLQGLGILSGLAGLMALLYGLQTDGPFKGLAKLAAKGLLSVSGFTKMFDGVVKKMLRYLVKIPKTLLGKFSTAITKMLGEGAGSTLIKTGLGKLTGFLPKFLAGALKFLKKVPFFGSLISIGFAVSRFKSGDVVGGGIEILSGIAGLFPGIGTGVSLALDALNAFLDVKAGGANKEASGKKWDMIKEFGGKVGSWLKEKLIEVPIIGPLIKGVTHLVEGDWKKGLKQLAYIVPAFEFIGAMMGDTETTGTAQAVAGGVKQVWEWTKELGSWIWEKMKKAPVIGPAIRGFQQIFEEGDIIGGLGTLARGMSDLSPLKWLIDWIAGPETVDTAISNTTGAIKNGLSYAKEIKDKLLQKVLEFIPESFMGISLRARVAEWMGVSSGSIQDEPAMAVPAGPTPQPPTKVADAAIDPSGGLLVSSPQEGSLFQLSKHDGVVAAPVAKDAPTGTSNAAKAAEQTYNKSDSILEKIAENTYATNNGLSNLASGFTALAKALEKMGAAVLEKPTPMPTIINQQAGQQDAKVRSTQAAKAGNANIANFRRNMEMLRQRPA
jgi:hypothetical protein